MFKTKPSGQVESQPRFLRSRKFLVQPRPHVVAVAKETLSHLLNRQGWVPQHGLFSEHAIRRQLGDVRRDAPWTLKLRLHRKDNPISTKKGILRCCKA